MRIAAVILLNGRARNHGTGLRGTAPLILRAVRYELLLQTGQAGVPVDLEKVDAALGRRELVTRPDGVKLWKLKSGEVEVRPLVEGGVPVATEVRVPLSDKLELIREAVVEGAALAAESELKLYDPQLSRTLCASDDGPVAEQFLRTAKYAGEMMGLPEAVYASFAPPEQGMKTGTKVILGISSRQPDAMV